MLELDFNKSNLIEEIGYAYNDLRIPMNIVWAKNKIDVTGWATIAMALISALSLWAAVRSNKKSLAKAQQQMDCQKQQWNDEFYLKYKQQKFIEFRTRFLKMVSVVKMFHNIMGPGIFGMDFFKPEEEGKFIYQPIITQASQTPNMLFSESMQSVNAFIAFMVNEEPFVDEIKWLYDDLLSFSQSFVAFLISVSNHNLMNKSFDQDPYGWSSHPDNDMRYLYLSHYPRIIRDNTSTSLLHAVKSKKFLNDLPGDNREKFLTVAASDVEFDYYLCIVNEWIELWKNTIDAVLSPSNERIMLSNDIDLKLEKVPERVNVRSYIKVTPDSMDL